MRQIWLVMKHDVAVILRQRSFWFVSLVVPVLLVGLQVFLGIQEGGLDSGSASEEQTEESVSLPPVGLVDPGGLIARIPPELPQGLFLRLGDVETARRALQAGVVAQVVLVPEDYITAGQVTLYARDFQILASGTEMGLASFGNQAWILSYLISYNLTGDEQLAAVLRNPTPSDLSTLHETDPAPPETAESRALAGIVSRVIPYVFYFLLLMAASYLMRSVVGEKENRTAEVLMVSLDARRLMIGKILAMSIILLIQVCIWAGGGSLAMDWGAGALRLPPLSFPPGFAVWAALFLVLGYLLFASIMAAAGAIATNAREANQVVWLLVIPLMPTLMFGELFAQQPTPPLVLALSLIPFSAPSAMVTRLAVATVPLWQLGFSLAILCLTTYGMVLLGARFFRSGNLLSEESFSWRRFGQGWRRKEGTD